jgi:hypothetical protein
MKLKSLGSIGKVGLVAALALGFVGSTINLPSYAWKNCERYGRHTGFGGPGGLGRGGYHFGDRFEDRHPRRSEVLGRDNRLNYTINRDRGHLGGNYGQLEQEQRSIRHQEQADARANGGYISTQEQAQLNREENQLNRQVKQDYRP